MTITPTITTHNPSWQMLYGTGRITLNSADKPGEAPTARQVDLDEVGAISYASGRVRATRRDGTALFDISTNRLGFDAVLATLQARWTANQIRQATTCTIPGVTVKNIVRNAGGLITQVVETATPRRKVIKCNAQGDPSEIIEL